MLNIKTVFGGLALVLAFDLNQPAYAYLDPGTGSIILQLLLGGVAGLAVVGKLYWQRVREFFGLSEKKTPEKSVQPTNE